MMDFQKGKIYRILQDNVKTVYIGSTVQPLSVRMAGHRKGIKHRPHVKLYKLMAEVGVDRFTIELVADFPCERHEQLIAEEGRHMRLNNTVEGGANDRMAGRTKNEYCAERKARLYSALLLGGYVNAPRGIPNKHLATLTVPDGIADGGVSGGVTGLAPAPALAPSTFTFTFYGSIDPTDGARLDGGVTEPAPSTWRYDHVHGFVRIDHGGVTGA